MLDFIEPPALIAWAVAAFSVGLYPIGLILGSSCNKCCDPQCAAPPFNRCMRDECITCTPLTGTSTRISSTADAFPPSHIPTNISGATQTAEYLAGDRCLEYQLNGQTYRRCIEPQNVLCGLALCDRPWLLPQTVTLATAGPCGQAVTAVGKLGIGSGGCRYFGAKIYCDFRAIIKDQGGVTGLHPSAFFANDLLYALEKGPYRNSVTISGSGTIALGGAPTLPDGGVTEFFYCANIPITNSNSLGNAIGKCISDVSVTSASLTRGSFVSSGGSPSVTGDPDALAFAEGAADALCAESYQSGAQAAGICNLAQNAFGTPSFIGARVVLDECGVESISAYVIRERTSASLWNGRYRVVASLGFHRGMSESDFLRTTFEDLSWDGSTISPRFTTFAWNITGSIAVSVTYAAPPVSASSRITATSPASLPWQGGTVAATAVNYDNTAAGTVSQAVAARTDAIQSPSTATVQVGIPPHKPWYGLTDGPAAIASVTQAYKPCGAVGFTSRWNGGEQQATTTFAANRGRMAGLITPLFEQSTPCDPEYSATASVPWITIERVAESESVCVTIESNTTGSPRQGEVQFSPTWMLSGQPSTSGSATQGTFGYVITQSA